MIKNRFHWTWVMGIYIAQHLVKHVEQLNIVTRNSQKTLSFISKSLRTIEKYRFSIR